MILDTSILVEIDRGADEARVRKLDDRAPHRISSVTVAEFFAGVHIRGSAEEEKAQRILSQAEEVPLGGQIARRSGELIARKKRQNLGINLNDIYIAATALEYGEKVMTTDVPDFEEVEELEILSWEEL